MYIAITKVCYDLTQDVKETELCLLDVISKEKIGNMDPFKSALRNELKIGYTIEEFIVEIIDSLTYIYYLKY